MDRAGGRRAVSERPILAGSFLPLTPAFTLTVSPSDAPPPLPSQPADIAPLLMDDVLHRLRLLDYISGFCAPKDIPPLHRLAFALPGPNPACALGAGA
jgi:hypothetical protein